MEKTMKAVVTYAPGDNRYEDFPMPELEDGEVLLKVKGCGICAGDLKAFHGGIRVWGTSEADRYMEPPCIPGHEFYGEVVDIKGEVPGIAIGDDVCAEQVVPCGHCHFCRTGKYWMCQRSAVFGFKKYANGGFAEYVKLPKASLKHADDITVYGRISNLTKVMKDTTRWAKETLGLTIKSAWDIIHFASFDAERQQNKRRKAGSHQRTPGLDMMGYVVRRTYTIIRGRNFVKLRRAILRAQRDLDALGYVPWWRAQRIMSQWGEIKHSDSRGFCQKYNVYKIIRAAKRSRGIVNSYC